MTWLAGAYLWIKALHVVSVIAWMAGMLYLPRLYVYHCDAEAGSAQSETFKTMERRLLRGVMNPAMLCAFLFGGALAVTPGVVDWSDAWPWAKAALIAAMTAVHGLFARWRRRFADDANRRSRNFYRAANEVPTLLLIATVVVVVVKPW